jgi:hypothetical protein
MNFVIIKTQGNGLVRKLVSSIKDFRVGTYTDDEVFGKVLIVKKWSTKK